MFRYKRIRTVRSPQRLVLALTSALCLLAMALVSGVFASSKAAAATISSWKPLGGTLTSGPAAVSWGPNREDVFVRGADNQLWHRWYAGGWSRWEPLGGRLTSDPDAASYGRNELDVFARGADGDLWHKWYPNSPTQSGWSPWQRFGGPVVGGPAVVAWTQQYPYYQREAVFARGTDNRMYARVQLGDFGSWTAWQLLGGSLTSDPDATVFEPGDRVDVFFRGTDHALWQGQFNAASDGSLTGGFASLGGTLNSGPGAWAVYQVTTGNSDEDVFVQGPDRRLWHRGWHPRFGRYWSNWEPLGGTLSSSPDVAYPGGTANTSDHRPGVDVFVRGANNGLYYLNYYGA